MTTNLYRSRSDKMFSGVCGGVSKWIENKTGTKIDTTIIRLLWVLSVLGYGAGLIFYLAAAIVVPLEPLPEE